MKSKILILGLVALFVLSSVVTAARVEVTGTNDIDVTVHSSPGGRTIPYSACSAVRRAVNRNYEAGRNYMGPMHAIDAWMSKAGTIMC